MRDYIHVSDLADLHVRALDHLVAGGDNLVANCGYGHVFSVSEVIAVKASPRRAGDPAELVADASLIGKRLAWKPRFDDLQTIILYALR